MCLKKTISFIATILAFFLLLSVTAFAQDYTDKEIENADLRISLLKDIAMPQRETLSDIIFYGDSRVVGMNITLSGYTYVGKVSMGYSWMTGEGLSWLENAIASHPDADIVFCFGVNDVDNVYSYANWFNSYAGNSSHRCWFMSVNPIDDGLASANGYFARNYMVTNFNAILSSSVGSRYLDVYSSIVSEGFGTTDGVHYTADTYAKIQDITVRLIENKL